MIPLLFVLVCVLVVAVSGIHLGVATVVLLVLWTVLLAWLWWRAERMVGRWMPRIRRQLRQQPWRPVPVRLVRSGGRRLPVIEFDDETPVQLRLMGAPVGTQYVLARHGRVWMVGPDDRIAVLRVDGLTGLIVGEVLATPRRESNKEPLLPPVTPGGTAADDSAASWVASKAVSAARRALFVRGVLRLCLPLAVLTFSVAINAVAVGAVLTLILLLLGTGSTLREWRKGRGLLQLPELLRAGPWEHVPARFERWSPGNGTTGFARARGELDGVAVTIPRASINLMVYARETGMLWVAGRPEPGRTAAVGIAGCPILAVAEFHG